MRAAPRRERDGEPRLGGTGGGRDQGGPGDPFAAARTAMLERQLRARGVVDPRVLAAMAVVPREEFVPDHLRDLAYADEALPIEHGQTISQPLMVGLMTQLLAPGQGDHVLDIGTGTGYQAAVLAEMGCRVTSVERLPALAAAARDRLAELGYGDAVDVAVGDGSTGSWGGQARWRGILVAAAAPRIPGALEAQLADGGRLVIPVGPRHEQELVLVERSGDRLTTTYHGACVFVPLLGEGGFR